MFTFLYFFLLLPYFLRVGIHFSLVLFDIPPSYKEYPMSKMKKRECEKMNLKICILNIFIIILTFWLNYLVNPWV